MRIFYSISLAALTLVSWMEGLHLCRQYIREVENQMEAISFVEQVLAQRYASGLQQGSTVKEVDSSFSGRQGYIYPGDFVLQSEIEGDTAHFIIESSTDSQTDYTFVQSPNTQNEYPPHTALEDFFPWYTAIWDAHITSKTAFELVSQSYPPYRFFPTSSAEDCPVQPPEIG